MDGIIASEREQRQRHDRDGYTITYFVAPDRRGVTFECYGPESESATPLARSRWPAVAAIREGPIPTTARLTPIGVASGLPARGARKHPGA